MRNPYAIGKTIYLRAPEKEDVEGKWYQWFSDPEVTQYLSDRWWPNTVELQAQFFESIQNTKDRLVLCICAKETDEHIGICSLSSINWVHRYADIALIIGDSKYRNGTVAIDTLALLADIAFNRLNLMNLKSFHVSINPFTPLLEKIFGFVEVGRYKELLSFKGDYVDAVASQLTRADWKARNQKSNKKVDRATPI